MTHHNSGVSSNKTGFKIAGSSGLETGLFFSGCKESMFVMVITSFKAQTTIIKVIKNDLQVQVFFLHVLGDLGPLLMWKLSDLQWSRLLLTGCVE